MPEVTVSAEIEASPKDVWAAVVDWERQREWVWLTRVTGGHGVGAAVSAYTGVGPVGFLDTMVITVWDPPRRCVVRHTGRVVRGSAAFEVEPLPGGRARFVWSEWLDLPFGVLGRLGFVLVRPLVLFGLRRGLRQLAGQLEAGRQLAR